MEIRRRLKVAGQANVEVGEEFADVDEENMEVRVGVDLSTGWSVWAKSSGQYFSREKKEKGIKPKTVKSHAVVLEWIRGHAGTLGFATT